MSDKQAEACGRCAMSTVVETVSEGDEAADRDPFGENRIEIEASELRRIAPGAWIGRLTARLDKLVQELTYGR